MTTPPPPPEPGLRRNSGENLERILGEMIDRPEAYAELAAEIDRDFGARRAVMVLDMSGFSRTTRQRGITAFLLMIHQMRRLAGPAVTANGGVIVKAEADNLFCLFETVGQAVAASRAIMAALETVNRLLPGDRGLYASIGLGYGRILSIDDKDIFGDEVNLASRLGEDVADQGMVLLTDAARGEAETQGIATKEETISLSGLSLSYHALV
jgi:adenylate cyclase